MNELKLLRMDMNSILRLTKSSKLPSGLKLYLWILSSSVFVVRSLQLPLVILDAASPLLDVKAVLTAGTRVMKAEPKVAPFACEKGPLGKCQDVMD